MIQPSTLAPYLSSAITCCAEMLIDVYRPSPVLPPRAFPAQLQSVTRRRFRLRGAPAVCSGINHLRSGVLWGNGELKLRSDAKLYLRIIDPCRKTLHVSSRSRNSVSERCTSALDSVLPGMDGDHVFSECRAILK